MDGAVGDAFPRARLLDGEPRAILFDATLCIGCRQCVQACKDWNDHPRTSPFELTDSTWLVMQPPVLDGLADTWGRDSCMHCDAPMCAAVCPVEAITKYDEGPVVIDQNVCIGCEYCIHACPWDVIRKDEVKGKASKCTMCSDRVAESLEPFCVSACPVDALTFGLRAEITNDAAQRAEKVGGHVYGLHEAGGTSVACVLDKTTEEHGLKAVSAERLPRHRIPMKLMLLDLFTLRLGLPAKAAALRSALRRPRRLAYRYWPWR